MASLSRQASAKAAKVSAPTSMIPPSSSAPFHGSRFFKALGRIDEESSFRASLSNVTSQDSSPRSSNNSEDSEGTDWLAALSPESHATFTDVKKQSIQSNQITNIDSGRNRTIAENQNVSVMITVSNVEDPKMDAAAALVENRQDRSSPITIRSQNQQDTSSSSSSPLYSSLSDHPEERLQQEQPQQLQERKDRTENREKMKRENEALRKKCEELESIMLQMKTEGNILQMRTVMKLESYQTEIDRATQKKQQLERQCHELEDRIWSLRNETRLKQESIWAAEEKLRQQRKREQNHGNVAAYGTEQGR